MAMSLSTLGEIAEKQEMLPAAWSYYCESLGLRQALGEDLAGVVDCLLGMGRVAHKMGDYDQAWYLFLNSLTFSQEIKNRWYTARSLYNLGLVACKLRKHQEAQNYLCRSLALFEKLGVKINMASSKVFVNSWAAVRAPDDPFVLNRC